MTKKVFDGVKVADFTWVGAGPITVKFLADHGATVIHIESRTQPEALRITPPFRDGIPGLNRSAYQASFNNNKCGLSLDLKHPRAREVLKRLVEWADIVAESFSPGTMARWGLAYEDLMKIKPGIIMYSTSQQGQTGRRAKVAAYGTQLVSLAGFTSLAGWPDRGPTGPYGPYTDMPTPPVGAAAIAAALDYRRRTGRGVHIDLSQYETGINFFAPVILDYTVNKRVQRGQGNRCSYAAPHGIFLCKGDDRWCAIAVFEDSEWKSLCNIMGNPAWAKKPEFSTLLLRKKNEDKLEKLLSKWTTNYDAEELMYKLQESGVPAGLVENAEDIHNDPQLAHRHYLWELDHPEIGKHSYEAPPFILSKTPAELNKSGPCLGEDTEYVCTRLLGIPDDHFIELLAQGVFE
jgi:crotonobetainyl-CoA:carnitine CoA-transferase CaiB-like acyl-CoA transferase